MLRHLNERLEKARRGEDGYATFFLFLMLFVILIGFFGLAMDTSRAVYARNQAQSTLDSATVAAATQLQTNRNVISLSNARALAEEFYTDNRSNISGLRCATSSDLSSVTSSARLRGNANCRWVEVSVRKPSSNQFQMGTRECVPNFFLTPFLDEFCFELSSTARTSQNVG